MNTFFLETNHQIPELSPATKRERNAWIAPNGDFYGFGGAKHELAATWISVFKLKANEKTLKKGQYFNESWEGWLLKQGWLCIKNLAWLGDSKPSTFRCFDWTQKQKDAVFDYCQEFGYDWQEILDVLPNKYHKLRE